MRILFFTPFSVRNGAEMMLWYLIKYADPQKFSFAVYSYHQGELLQELPPSVPYFTPPSQPSLPFRQRLKRKIAQKVFGKKIEPITMNSHIKAIHNDFKPDTWYINTILCPEVCELAIQMNIPYVVHFHELPSLYQNISYHSLKQMITGSSLLLGCAKSVCEKLTIMQGQNIALQYECIDVDKVNVDEDNAEVIRRSLGIKTSFVWVMSGAIAYRKGTDIFPMLAQLMGEDVTLIWIGPGSSGYSFYIEQELNYFGIQNVKIVGDKADDYYDYLSLADGLVLTSREDPFPLVMIEAAALGKPIVGFNSGGVSEFVKIGMGVVIDSNNVSDLSEAMKSVMQGKIEVDKQSLISRAKEFDVKVQVKHWESLLTEKLGCKSIVA